jgi:hypothetical protein
MHVSVKEPDKSDMSILKIENERQIAEFGIDQIAHELWGGSVSRQFPIYLVLLRGRAVGFFQAIQQTCVYPGIHPEMMTPREFVKVVKSLVTEMKRHVGNPLFMLCKKATEIGPKGMRMVRLKKAPEEAYVYTEEES